MKNRYCLFCGTLLPEDGVCLRCGAKYQLADDGQLKVIPRKVKKVSAKTTPKNRFTVKAKQEPSEAETQTIPIPEDVYSFSDDVKSKDPHADWTGDSNSSKNDSAKDKRVPNHILQEGKQSISKEESRTETRRPPIKRKSKMISAGALALIFFISTIIAGLVMYYFLDSKDVGAKSNDEQLIASSTQNLVSTTDKEVENSNPISELLKCKINYSSGGNATYAYDEEQKALFISLSGSDEYSYAFLPLISLGRATSNLVYLASLTQPPFQDAQLPFEENYPILFCYSDLIRNGSIRNISVKTDNESREYSFSLNGGLLDTVLLNGSTSYGGAKEQFRETMTYEYDSLNRLNKIDSDSEYNGYHLAIPLFEFRYSQNGDLESYDWYYFEIKDYFPETVLIDYDNQKRITKTYYDTRNEALYDYQYDGANRLIKLVGDRPSGYAITTLLTYTSDGLLSTIQTAFDYSDSDNAIVQYSY